jgi:hypothetical protein
VSTTEQFRQDAAFLREIASREKDRGWNSPEQVEDVERIERIADNVEMMAQAMFEPRLNSKKTRKGKQNMRITTITYAMLRKTDTYENDRAEVTVEINEGESLGEAVKLAKRACERALVTSAEEYDGF